MTERGRIGLGVASGLLWSAVVLWLGTDVIVLPVFSLLPALAFSMLGPGIVLAVMAARRGLRWSLDDASLPAADAPSGRSAGIDGQVRADTTEQAVLALLLWPPSAYLLGTAGPGMAATLGAAFILARLVFWFGCHRSASVRAVGYAATIFPTLLVPIWAALGLAL